MERTYANNELDTKYNFSFLDNIREITGYLLIHNNQMKSFKLKSLQIVRGKNKFLDRHTVYIDGNNNLESLDLSNLKGIFTLIYNHIKLQEN
jgi:hypothetical protein